MSDAKLDSIKVIRISHHIIEPRTMSANAIIAKPEGQIVLSLVPLHGEVVSLATELVPVMFCPDEVASCIKKHGSGIRDAPASRSNECEQAIITSRTPLQEVCLGRIHALGGDVAACRVVAKGALVDSLIVDRRRPTVCGGRMAETERQMA